MIERLREVIARRLITMSKWIDPGNKALYDARAGWRVDFQWRQPTSLSDHSPAVQEKP